MRHKIKSNRILFGIAAFMVLAALLLSSIHIIAQADHDCNGEHCPVCEFIFKCDNTIRQLGGLKGESSILYTAAVLFLLSVLICSEGSFKHTLVSKKVRLND